MSPEVTAAIIAASVSFLTLIGTLAAQYFGRRATSRDTQKSFAEQREQLHKTLAAQGEQLDRTLAEQREGQVTDRYTKAIEQLGSDKLHVRIGGVYALERVARDSARDHPTVMEVLTAFIRYQSREQWPPPDAGGRERSTRPDVQAAVTVVGRRDAKRDKRKINLYNANLTRADLRGANLNGATLRYAILTRADLRDAILVDADLRDAHLRDAQHL